MQIQTQIQKWGNGLGLRVSGILRDLPHFQADDKVQVEVTEHGFSVTKLAPKNSVPFQYTEAELLACLSPERIHADDLAKPLPGEWL